MLCKILKHYPNADNWQVGDVVEITDARVLLEQGLVEEYKEKPKAEAKAEPKVKKAKK